MAGDTRAKWLAHSLVAYIVLFLTLIPSCLAENTIHVYNQHHHGCYVFDLDGRVAGFLLNGCPLDETIITIVELEYPWSPPDEIETPLLINESNTNAVKTTDTAFPWARTNDYGTDLSLYSTHPGYTSTDAVVSMMPINATIVVMGRIGEYYYTEYEGTTGYIHSSSVIINAVSPQGEIPSITYPDTLQSYRVIPTMQIEESGLEDIKKADAYEIAYSYAVQYYATVELARPRSLDVIIDGLWVVGNTYGWKCEVYINGSLKYHIFIDSRTGELLFLCPEDTYHG